MKPLKTLGLVLLAVAFIVIGACTLGHAVPLLLPEHPVASHATQEPT